MQEAVLDASCRVQGEEHRASVKAMQNLARTCWNMSDYETTEALERRILTIKQRLLGNDDEVLEAMNDLATTLAQLNMTEEASALKKEARAIRRRRLDRPLRKARPQIKAKPVRLH